MTRARWVHPDTHSISKFFPQNPPRRGERILVDGVPSVVVRCPVRWRGRAWQMKRGVKVRALSEGGGDE